jgi:endonuclease/exonuclease/phosphatase family metal-dependent hydrolase
VDPFVNPAGYCADIDAAEDRVRNGALAPTAIFQNRDPQYTGIGSSEDLEPATGGIESSDLATTSSSKSLSGQAIDSMLQSMRLMSWNMGRSVKNWAHLLSLGNVDIALLQEAVPPGPAAQLRQTVPSAAGEPWSTGKGRRFCAAIARLSDRVTARPIPTSALGEAGPKTLGVSMPGSLAAAEVTEAGETITVVSIYAAWASPLSSKTRPWIYGDASAHRLISDISALVESERRHKLIVAGDLNILYGYGDHGSPYWKGRYESVFARMEALGIPFIGPQHPAGTKCAVPPRELPSDSLNVPTFRTRRANPSSATRQIDFVFASRSLAGRLTVCALNSPEQWGPSDHCCIEIDLKSRSG